MTLSHILHVCLTFVFVSTNLVSPPPQLQSLDTLYGTDFQNLWKVIDAPYNTLIPPTEASINYESTRRGPLGLGERILADHTLFRPTATWDVLEDDTLYTILLLDISIRNNASVVQWLVTNIEGNNILGGDEIMEYVTPVAWRNCNGGKTNHGESCSGEGVIYDSDYVHNNTLLVFKQPKGVRIDLPATAKNTGCQMNLQSSLAGQHGPWTFTDVQTFMSNYNLDLFAGTYFVVPYSSMVASVLCQYHACYGTFFSNFLAGATSLPAITDNTALCGERTDYMATVGTLDNGDRDPLDWSQLICRNCKAATTVSQARQPRKLNTYNFVRTTT